MALQAFKINDYKTIYAKDRNTALKIWAELKKRGVL